MRSVEQETFHNFAVRPFEAYIDFVCLDGALASVWTRQATITQHRQHVPSNSGPIIKPLQYISDKQQTLVSLTEVDTVLVDDDPYGGEPHRNAVDNLREQLVAVRPVLHEGTLGIACEVGEQAIDLFLLALQIQKWDQGVPFPKPRGIAHDWI